MPTQYYFADRSSQEKYLIDSGYDDGLPPISPVHLEATISLPTGHLLSLGTLNMLSISQHRETFPVTSLGWTGPQGYTRGHRLIAGTMVFSVFEHGAFMSLITPLEAPSSFVNKHDQVKGINPSNAFFDMSPDSLPPFDLHLVYVTPVGMVCYEGLRGVHIVDEGSIRSIDMPQIQESYSYMAQDRIPLQRLADYKASRKQLANTLLNNPYTNDLTNMEAVTNAISLLG